MEKEHRSELTGGVMIISSFFILLTILYPQTTGIVGSFVFNLLLSNLLGRTSYLFPLFLGVVGVILLFPNSIKNSGRRVFGLTWVIINLSALIETFLSDAPLEFIWPIATGNGGIFGNLYALGLQKVFGMVGAYFIIVVSLWISVLLILDITLKSFFISLRNLLIGEKSSPEAGQKTRRIENVRPARVVQRPVKSMAEQRQVRAVSQQSKPTKQSMFGSLKDMFGFTETNELAPALARVNEPAVAQGVRPIRRMVSPDAASEMRNPVVRENYVVKTDYKMPPMSLLKPPVRFRENQRQLDEQFDHDKQVLESTLASFNVAAKVCNISHGPAVTRYELMPSPGVRVNKIENLADDISLSMASTVRIEAPVPGKSVVGIEVPNEHTRPVNLSEMTEQPAFNNHPLTVALGLDIGGKPIFCNLNEMPHLLIAGATGSGKSVCINSLIMSILLKASPEQVKFLMIDPKRVELMNYNDIPHLVAPVVNEPHLAQLVLKLWAIKEMEQRYEIFSKAGVRNIEGFNKLAQRQGGRVIQVNMEVEGNIQRVPYTIQHMPYVVIIIDELADLMMVGSREVEGSICRIAQMARATGIHLVIATQRPSVDVITGLIKANVPSRVAFAVGSHIDSRTIIDGMGAEKLLGRGDMLYSPVGARHLTRVQGVYVSDEEIAKVTNYIKRQCPPQYELDLRSLQNQVATNNGEQRAGSGLTPNQREDGRDVLFDQAAQLVASTGKRSISYIQRKFRIGYNRAARIVEELEEAGVVNPNQ